MDKVKNMIPHIIMCAIETVIGVLLFINPVGFTSGILIAFGVVMTCLGVLSIIQYFRRTPSEAMLKNELSKGIIFVLIGLFCMFRSKWFILTFPMLTIIYGILTLLMGVSKIQWAVDMLRFKQKYWFVAMLGSVLTTIFSILIIANPFTSTSILWKFIAVSMIIEAVIDLISIIFGSRQFK